jgi:regulator of protease activity HflC (stomatin/prohibitin superfamily)
MGYLIGVVLALLFLLLVASNIRVVPQSNGYVIERLGAYLTTWETGLHFKIPLIDRISKKVSLKEMVADFPPQPVITKDNVTMKIDTVVYYQITDPKLFTYGVAMPIVAIENLTATTLRNIIGQLELDETLSSRDIINTQMRAILDEATDPWGIKVNRVELKNILPPKDIQDAMEKQMRAERERRESILRAEGEKRSAILIAEGKKESVILSAEAEKQAAILRAEAKKEAQIREAEGEAEAILKIQKATAMGLDMIKEVHADQSVLALKSFEALAKVADGQATKLIIPSELTNVANIVASIKEAASLDKAK